MKKKFTLVQIVYIGVMAALVCAVTFFRFPLLGSKVHFANAMCLLSGLLMGGVARNQADRGKEQEDDKVRECV